MKRFIVHLLCTVSIMLCNSAAANFSTQNAKGVPITFLEAAKNSISDEVLSQAMSLKGIKYKYGGTSPQTGFDCSGFVNYVFNKAANEFIHAPSTGSKVSVENRDTGYWKQRFNGGKRVKETSED